MGGSGTDFPLAGGLLTIDLSALARNYRRLVRLSAPAEAAAVVKADAYGIGVGHAVPALLAAGCRRFFVALPAEGIAVRGIAPDAEIYVLDGLFGTEAVRALVEHRLTPVLNSQSDISMWESAPWDDRVPRACVIHVDTGMNRLGLSMAEAKTFVTENALTGAVRPVMVMSHLACADQPGHAMNRRQLESFHAVRRLFSGIESSLANSAGVLIGGEYLSDLTRPGIALYGGEAVVGIDNPFAPVVTAEARILQVRQAKAGETVGYGATARLVRDTVIAVAAAGYADGLPRAASGAGVVLRRVAASGGQGFLRGQRVTMLGRVSMDLCAFDVTGLGMATVGAGDMIELFGPHIALDEAARAAGTIGYELLTLLGRRFHRAYVMGETD